MGLEAVVFMLQLLPSAETAARPPQDRPSWLQATVLALAGALRAFVRLESTDHLRNQVRSDLPDLIYPTPRGATTVRKHMWSTLRTLCGDQC